jgi:hypothetical protein
MPGRLPMCISVGVVCNPRTAAQRNWIARPISSSAEKPSPGFRSSSNTAHRSDRCNMG